MKDNSVGIILVREVNGARSFLLVHEIGGHWGFPKGHPNFTETEIATAARELFEETRIDTFDFFEDFRYIGKYSFKKGNLIIEKEVVFFLGRIDVESLVQPTNEVLDAEWLPLSKALERLTYEESRKMLKEVEIYIKKLVSPKLRRHQYDGK